MIEECLTAIPGWKVVFLGPGYDHRFHWQCLSPFSFLSFNVSFYMPVKSLGFYVLCESILFPSLSIHTASWYVHNIHNCWSEVLRKNTVDGRNPHQLICRLSHYLQGFIHPRWLLGISSMNSMYVFLVNPHAHYCQTVDDSAGTEFLTLAAAPKVWWFCLIYTTMYWIVIIPTCIPSVFWKCINKWWMNLESLQIEDDFKECHKGKSTVRWCLE